MKVKRKNVYVREDCFSATSKDAYVDIQAYGHIVVVTLNKPHFEDGSVRIEFTLEQLAKQLLK